MRLQWRHLALVALAGMALEPCATSFLAGTGLLATLAFGSGDRGRRPHCRAERDGHDATADALTGPRTSPLTGPTD